MGFVSSLRLWLNNNNNNRQRGEGNSARSSTISNNKETQGTASSTHSSSSSTNKPGHRYEAGRRFHDIQDVSYLFPNDDEEVDRIHQQHWIVRHIMQGNFQSPVHEALEKGIQVLDSGCGPATWCLDMAEMYPQSTFHGVDAYPVFPSEVKPANCHFYLANVADHLPFPDNYFDFIHQRLLLFGLTRNDWRRTIQELLRVLKPGGWLEIIECDIEFVNEGPKQKRVMQAIFKAFEQKNMSHIIARELGPQYLKPTGQLEDLHEKIVPFPLNHGGKLGELFWADFQQACEALHAWLSKIDPLFQDLQTYKTYLATECAPECRQNKTDMVWHCYYGRKKQQ